MTLGEKLLQDQIDRLEKDKSDLTNMLALAIRALEKIAKPMREDEHPNDYAARLRYTAIDALPKVGAGRTAPEGHNAKSQATDAALSRQVACTDGLEG